jgi:hypothetical protein
MFSITEDVPTNNNSFNFQNALYEFQFHPAAIQSASHPYTGIDQGYSDFLSLAKPCPQICLLSGLCTYFPLPESSQPIQCHCLKRCVCFSHSHPRIVPQSVDRFYRCVQPLDCATDFFRTRIEYAVLCVHLLFSLIF